MRIIKMGDPNPQRMICGSCGCEFEYINTDIQIEHGVWGNSSYVECPCCHQRIYLSQTKDMPGVGDSPTWPPYGTPNIMYCNNKGVETSNE